LRAVEIQRARAETEALVERIQKLGRILPAMAHDTAEARREVARLRKENAQLVQRLTKDPWPTRDVPGATARPDCKAGAARSRERLDEGREHQCPSVNQTEREMIMSIIDEALSANATIASDFDPSLGKPPAPKIAIVTCADPRLSNILPMLGLAEADVDMIRNFGTVIDDDAIRSLVLSTRLLGTREIMIINHTDCGMLRFTDSEMEERLREETGRAPIAPARFYSFTDAEQNTKEQIQKARSHPWLSEDVPVRGFVYDVGTGRLSEVFPGKESVTN
jgi:carbonic anhydrase